MIHLDQLVRIGTITKTHGIGGEINFAFTTDVWDTVEANHLIIVVEGLPVPFFLDEYRFRNDTTAILSLVGIDTQEQAAELVGCDVMIERDQLAGAEDEYTWQTLVGYTIEGVGRITDVDDSTENVLFCVGDRLIPAAEDWIEDIDHEAQVIRMSLPEGLLELDS